MTAVYGMAGPEVVGGGVRIPCPDCGRQIANVKVAMRNHRLTHEQGGHPNRRRKPYEPCIDCGVVPNWTKPKKRGSRVKPEGAIEYGSRGRCAKCMTTRVRNQIQPPGTPTVRRRKQADFVEDLLDLRGAGLSNEQVRERLGMKPLSFKRAVHRARAAGVL